MAHKRTLIFALGLAATLLPARQMTAQQQVSPRHSVLDSSALLRTGTVDSLFQSLADSTRPGCAFGLFQRGQIALFRGYGMANIESRVPIALGSVFQIGSESKQFTAFAIHRLAERQLLSLDDDVRRYVPELPVYRRRISLRHLLHHTSGLRDYYELAQIVGIDTDAFTDSMVASLVFRQRSLNFAPGDGHAYSNTNYWLLARVVEHATGRSFADAMRELVFVPLGMTGTFFRDGADATESHRAYTYLRTPQGSLQRRGALGSTHGATGVYTTLADLARWSHVLASPPRELAPTVAAMLLSGRLRNGRRIPYASGIRVSTLLGHRYLSHGGADDGYVAHVFHFPSDDLGGAVLCNTGRFEPWRVSSAIAELAVGEKSRATVAHGTRYSPGHDSAQIRRLAGWYVRSNGDVTNFVYRDGVLLNGGNAAFALRAESARRFQVGQIPVWATFERSAHDGHANAVTMEILGVMPRRFVRAAEWKPSAATLSQFRGSYVFADMDLRLSTEVHGDSLMLTRAGAAPVRLVPTVADCFVDPTTGLHLKFERTARGTVRALLLNTDTGRSEGYRFVRAP